MAAKLYFSDAKNRLYSIDSSSNKLAPKLIGVLSVAMSDMALSPDGQLYGISYDALYKINAKTGQATLIADHTFAGANGFFIGPDGTAYISSNAYVGTYTLNLATGETSVLPASSTNYNSSTTDGKPWAGDIAMIKGELVLTAAHEKFILIDPVNGATIEEVSHGIEGLSGIAAVGNTLYGVANGSLYSFNLATGGSTLIGNYGLANITGAAAADYGQSGVVRSGTVANNILTGTVKDDVLIGFAGRDSLWGGSGKDLLIGGDGRDMLRGGHGGDTLQGGGGADKFVFASLRDSYGTGNQRDVITDFDATDVIDLSRIDARNPTRFNNAFAIDTDGTLKIGEIRLIAAGEDTIIAGNVDTDSNYEFTILVRSATLTSDDFIL